MTPRRIVCDPENMATGEQLGLFVAAPESVAVPEPAVMAGPARPAAPVAPLVMSPSEAAWVIEHVIADYHLANEHTWGDPDQNWEPRCRCQMPCALCRDGQHARCRELREATRDAEHGPFAPGPETHLRAPAPYRLQRTRPLYVAVWLADRQCRALYDCPQCATEAAQQPGRTTVVCLKGRRDDPAIDAVVYVGRPMYQGGWRLHGHPLANPYRVGRHGTAEECVAKYRVWLEEHRQLLERELPKLKGQALGCWCAEGEPCHARVLAELADSTGVAS